MSQLSTSGNTNKALWLELRTKTEILKSTEERLSEKIKAIERQEHDIQSLTELNLEIKNTVQTVQKKNIHVHEHLRRQRTVDLQIWFQRTDILTQVAGEIQEQVKNKCQQTADMVVNCFTPDAQADLQPSKPTLVLCINASRLGTDVLRALDNIKGSPAVAVIVLHHKARHALPNQSSDKVLTSPEYKELGGVFDMAFLAEQWLYPCSMNDMALKGTSGSKESVTQQLKPEIIHNRLKLLTLARKCDMGNISGTQSPQTAFRTEYNGLKTKLAQIQTVGIGVLETLKSYAEFLDSIIACQAPEQKWKLKGKTDDSGQHNHIQKTRDSLQIDGVLQMQSILDSIKALDLSIQTIFFHFAESFPQSLKKTWLQTVQNSFSGEEENTEYVPQRYKSRLYFFESLNKAMKSHLNVKTEYIKALEAKLREAEQQTIDDTNTLRAQVSTLESQNRELQSQLSTKIECIQSIEAKLCETEQQTTYEATRLRSQLSASENLNKELQLKLRTGTENHESILCENMKTFRQQEDNIRFLTDKIHDLKTTVQTIQTENSHLNEKLRRQRTVDLQIWYQRTDILTKVAREIQEQVKTKCQQTADMVVNCYTPVSQADLKPDTPIIVLCINAFGPCTDVPVALNNIQGSPDVAVIVLHHKAKHALPYQSTDKVLTSPVYKQLGAIFDMAFLAQQGIYHCDMNDKALKRILEFLKYRIFQREW